MAEKNEAKSRKRKHFEMEKSRQSRFQNASSTEEPAGVVKKAPRGINAAEFAESRALEIRNMMRALSSASEQSNKRVFQSLPRHMRRRAASHNSKRMPVRLRDAYNMEATKMREKQKEPKQFKQKKSRRHRRKPSNLLQEYNRRQRNHVWMETHIWHAKRFKMVEKWGYKIPLHPNDKSVRASYRAMTNGCLLQDITYYQCIEVHGQQDLIVAAMKHLTSSDIGLTMAAKEYLNGAYEGQTILFKYDQYPYHAIGPIMFLWQQHLGTGDDNQQEGNTSAIKKLWLWCHPMCSEEIAKEIVNACSLQGPTEYVDTEPWLSEGTDPVTGNKDSSNGKASENGSALIVTVLREQLVRLRLTGPKSHTLLAATLELCDWSTQKDKTGSRWWQVYSKGEDRGKMFEEQNEHWKQMKGVASSAVLKAGCVMALVVNDPRLGLPVTKSSVDMAAEDLYKAFNNKKPTFASSSANSAVSPLWDCEVRKQVKQNKMPEKDLNNLRSKQAVPGSKLDLGDETSRIPMLVIQQPGTTGNHQMGLINFGSGYDVIFPAGWSMPFWIALVYRGARVGGTRELETCSREQGVPHFPRDFPDTKAGREYNEDQKRTGKTKYERYPPAKRPNYVKFGMASPFGPDWNTLVNEWRSEVQGLEPDMTEAFSSNSCKQIIAKDCLSGSDNGGVYNGTLADNTVHCEDSDSFKASTKDQNRILKDVNTDNSLLNGTDKDKILQEGAIGDCERVDMDIRTSDPKFNVIRSLPTRRRLQDIIFSLHLATKKRHQKHKLSNEEITEFLTKNIASYSRSLICLNLRSLLKGSPQDNAMIYIPTSEDLQQLEKDRNYGGPVEPIHKCNNTTSSTMIRQCSRKVIGWVTSGQYSFARGQGFAVGFSTFSGFCELITRTLKGKSRPLVLVRNTNTVQYRFANLTVL